MGRGSHHSSGGHHGSHHSSGGSHHSYSSSHHSYRSSYHGSYRSGSGYSSRPSSEPPEGVTSYHGSWLTNNSFYLNMSDPMVKIKVQTAKIQSPTVLYTALFFLWFVCMFLYSNNIFYEIVIPIFEVMPMNDLTFKIFDDLIYMTPLIVIFISTLVVIFWVRSIKEKQRAVCKEVIEYYKQQEFETKVELEKQDKINNTDWYTECPNCGAPVTYGAMNCEYCGSSLEKPESK